MKGKETAESREGTTDNLWGMYINMLYVIVLSVILLFVYLAVRTDIDSYLNRKIYSAEELAAFQQEAEARERSRVAEMNWDKVVDGIHIRTGLHDDENLQIIIGTCTSCHSAKLITQNSASRDGWKSMIRWMQETQGLGQLGKNEPVVLDYLAKYYAPVETGRRKTLDMAEIEWYELDGE